MSRRHHITCQFDFKKLRDNIFCISSNFFKRSKFLLCHSSFHFSPFSQYCVDDTVNFHSIFSSENYENIVDNKVGYNFMLLNERLYGC